MNWLDMVLAAILLVSVIQGFRRGFSRQVIGLVSGIAALLLGLWLYGTAGAWLLPYLSSAALAHAAGFAIVFCGVLILGAIVSFFVGRFLRVTGLSFFDHVLGAVFGVLRWIVVATAIVMGTMAFSRGDRPPAAIVESRMAPFVVDSARLVAAVAPHELKEGFRKTYAQVKAAWGSAIEKGIRSLPEGGKRNEG
jgi:uncharacterized membrane protein required for colicin V production